MRPGDSARVHHYPLGTTELQVRLPLLRAFQNRLVNLVFRRPPHHTSNISAVTKARNVAGTVYRLSLTRMGQWIAVRSRARAAVVSLRPISG